MKNISSYSVQSLERALTLLETLAENQDGHSLKTLSEKTGLHKSTVYRLLRTMLDAGYVYQDAETERYSLGTRILYLSNSLLESMDMRTIARPYIKELCLKTNEVVQLIIRQGTRAVYIDRFDSPNRLISMYSHIGKSIPLYCSAAGKVLLAWLPEEKIHEIVGPGPFKTFTKSTIGDLDTLLSHLANVRHHGFATDWFEHEDSIFCFAAPICNNQNRVLAAVSIASTPLQFNPEHYNEFSEQLYHTARTISERLGCTNYPANFIPISENVRSMLRIFDDTR